MLSFDTSYVEDLTNEEKEIISKEVRKARVDGSMKVERMTYEEIIEAGIDISDSSNYHYEKWEVRIDMGARTVECHTIAALDEDGTLVNKITEIIEVLNNKFSTTSTTTTTNTNQNTGTSKVTTTTTACSGDGGYSKYNGPEIVVPVNDRMYLIISGETKWMKEFFHVQLLIINNDSLPIYDLKGTMDIPKGLTLSKGSKSFSIGKLESGDFGTIEWIIRGDAAGNYNLFAELSGIFDGEVQTFKFETESPLHVLAENALHMTIKIPKVSYYGEKYPVKIELKNVSDFPVYNLTQGITGWKEVVVTEYAHCDLHGHLLYYTEEEEVIKSGAGTGLIRYPTLNPGESVLLEVSIDDVWESMLEQARAAADKGSSIFADISGKFGAGVLGFLTKELSIN